MLIQELTRQASLDLLARTRFGRLACAQGAQPYVVPFYFVYDNDCLYSFSTIGQKIEWMRANPLVCVEADEVVSPHQGDLLGSGSHLFATGGVEGEGNLLVGLDVNKFGEGLHIC